MRRAPQLGQKPRRDIRSCSPEPTTASRCSKLDTGAGRPLPWPGARVLARSASDPWRHHRRQPLRDRRRGVLVQLARARKVAQRARDLARRLARVGNERTDLRIGPLPLDQHVVQAVRLGAIEGAGADDADHALQRRRLQPPTCAATRRESSGAFATSSSGSRLKTRTAVSRELLAVAGQRGRLEALRRSTPAARGRRRVRRRGWRDRPARAARRRCRHAAAERAPVPRARRAGRPELELARAASTARWPPPRPPRGRPSAACAARCSPRSGACSSAADRSASQAGRAPSAADRTSADPRRASRRIPPSRSASAPASCCSSATPPTRFARYDVAPRRQLADGVAQERLDAGEPALVDLVGILAVRQAVVDLLGAIRQLASRSRRTRRPLRGSSSAGPRAWCPSPGHRGRSAAAPAAAPAASVLRPRRTSATSFARLVEQFLARPPRRACRARTAPRARPGSAPT